MITSENERLRMGSPEKDSKVRVLAEEIAIWKSKHENLSSKIKQNEDKIYQYENQVTELNKHIN